ncbi:MAG: CoA activase, partial [Deltaproteobacteria bacterium]|nr:CoA activase [Deltaproteobacteria bacterium]
AVVLLGRPYTCLPRQMNKGIPVIIAALGVKAFFQDMIRPAPEHAEEIAELLETVHWHFAAEILTAACVVARTPGLYPVLVTSFKCTPDACTVDYVRRLCDRYEKPYLVLELDEHDSALGYETRIEAGIAAFRNHHAQAQRRRRAPRALPIHYPPSTSVRGRTLFLPQWDDLACPLLAANLNRVGIPTYVLSDGPDTTQKGMRRNSGQCAPLTIIAQGFIEAVEERGMDPGQTVLWCIESQIACNLGMFASVLRSMLAETGRGFERATVFPGEISMVDLTLRGALDVFFAYMFAGYLRRMACRVRPYERQPGEADRALAAGLAAFQDVFAGRRDKLETVVEVVDRFAAIDVTPRDRPRVAIFGDMFTRDNDSQNQDLIRFIEQHGGEAVTTPYSEYVKVVAESYLRRWLREGKVLSVAVHRSLLATARHLERRFATEFARVLGPLPRAALGGTMEEVLAPYGVTERHTGETVDNLLKIASLLQDDPDLSLFVQANPAFCCPSLVTEAMAARIEEVTGVPVVTVTYDGTIAPKNDVIVPYLAFARDRGARPRRPARDPGGHQPRRRLA